MGVSAKNGSSRARSTIEAVQFAPAEQPATTKPRDVAALKEEQRSAA